MNNVILVKKTLTVFFLFFILLVSAIAEEASSPITITTTISPDNFTIGDIATYTISIQHDPDILPSAPDFLPPKGLEFIDKGEHQPQTDHSVHEYWYKLRVDAVGKLILPSIPISFVAPDPKESGKTIQGTIQAPEATLEVQSLLAIAESPEGIRDIKPLEEISRPWAHYLWFALGALALAGILYFIWSKWKDRPLAKTDSAQPLSLTPEELAFKELEDLRGKGLLEIGRVQDHFFELSEIFRRYLENRYQFPAREWTTEEITGHFKKFPALDENLKHQARSILTQTDRIKFAKAERIEGLDEIQSVINFIQEANRPVSDPQATNPS